MTTTTRITDVRGLRVALGRTLATKDGLTDDKLIELAKGWCAKHRMEICSLTIPIQSAQRAASHRRRAELTARLARNHDATLFLMGDDPTTGVIWTGLDQEGRDLDLFLQVMLDLINETR